jgi:hypothetical protein
VATFSKAESQKQPQKSIKKLEETLDLSCPFSYNTKVVLLFFGILNLNLKIPPGGLAAQVAEALDDYNMKKGCAQLV